MIRRLLALIPELSRLRLSSIDPAAIDDDLWRLIAEEPRLMPHLHLSLQAGSDLILKRMRRRHGRAEAISVISRARVPAAGYRDRRRPYRWISHRNRRHCSRKHCISCRKWKCPTSTCFPTASALARRLRGCRRCPCRYGEHGPLACGRPERTVADRFLASHVGRMVSVLAEAVQSGHSEHFAPVRLTARDEPGAIAEGPGDWNGGRLVAGGGGVMVGMS